jgi:hypothetical protein
VLRSIDPGMERPEERAIDWGGIVARLGFRSGGRRPALRHLLQDVRPAAWM